MLADPEIEYGTIELDFPWPFKNPGAMHGANGRKGTRPKYECWTIPEILAFEIPYLIGDSSTVHVWAPAAHIHIAILSVTRLGFRYTGQVRAWHKPQPANGYDYQNDLEYVVMGVRGPRQKRHAWAVKSELGWYGAGLEYAEGAVEFTRPVIT